MAGQDRPSLPLPMPEYPTLSDWKRARPDLSYLLKVLVDMWGLEDGDFVPESVIQKYKPFVNEDHIVPRPKAR